MNAPVVDHDDPDLLCLACGLRTFSGCTCPKDEPTQGEIELGRLTRLTKAELLADRRASR